MKIYYVANARMPNEKAHGIQIAKMCEAFIEAGVDLTLVVPRRMQVSATLQAFYGLRRPIPLRSLWVPDLYTLGRFGFFMSSIFFMARYSFFLLGKRLRGDHFLLYTIDMDTFSSMLLPLFGRCITEMHSPKGATFAQCFFFKRAYGTIATSWFTRKALLKTFRIPEGCVIVEPNGVDVERFALPYSKNEARSQLSLPIGEKIALYVGRFYRWKGLEILPPACEKLLAAGIACYIVGGDREELERLLGRGLPANLHCMGARGAKEVSLWLAASDVALVLGTAHNEDSFRVTSPMKLFEYMAAGVPLVASRTPALTEVLTEQETLFYTPDDAGSLAEKIIEAIAKPEESVARAKRASIKARMHTWERRAERILAFCTT